MRNQTATPARQLASVCSRFCNPWCDRAGDDWPRPLAPRVGSGRTTAGDELEDEATLLARLEAVLFLANEPLNTRKLAQLASLEDGTRARTLLRRLNQDYDSAARAFRIEEVAGGYQLRSRPEFARWIRRMVGAPPEIRMSAPSMETLAVVAYRQPVLRAEIESVRGVQCGEILRQLMERGMVRIAGRSNELGRPFLYGTTRNFLQVFGLRSLDELPRASMLRKSNLDVYNGGDSEHPGDEDKLDEDEFDEDELEDDDLDEDEDDDDDDDDEDDDEDDEED